MPLHRYDKEAILDTCLQVFARHGYEGTSAAMLAQAAGISKALLFHHFGSKRQLYLTLLDSCATRGRAALAVESLASGGDFFGTRRRFSLMKYQFAKREPVLYRVLMAAYLHPPAELKADIEARVGQLMAERVELWSRLFRKVPLRNGVDRELAFELVMLTIDHFERKYIAEMTPRDEPDDQHVMRFLDERDRCLDLIRHGIQA